MNGFAMGGIHRSLLKWIQQFCLITTSNWGVQIKISSSCFIQWSHSFPRPGPGGALNAFINPRARVALNQLISFPCLYCD